MAFFVPFRKLVIASILTLPVITLNVHSALAGELTFQLHNESSLDIHYLFVSNSGNETWGEDILQNNEVIASGEVGAITISEDTNACLYDIKAVAADGETTVELYQVNICEEQVVTFGD